MALVCLWAARFAQNLAPESWTRLAQVNWWASTQILFYAVVPLVALAVTGTRPSDVGWRFSGTRGHSWIYGALFVVAVPFLVVASSTADFQDHYPIYDVVVGQSNVWRDLTIWWPFYVVQFVAVETFFRGVLVIGLASRFGKSSILIAAVPYMMIHFVKPPAEAAAAIAGSLVLGYLALRTRSIIWGIALHIAIAGTMDVLSLGRKGFLW